MSVLTRAGARPLSGVRIVDMSRLAPGPYCTMLLADLGAEVIVIGGGRAGVPVSTFSRGKRFITLDLKSEQGRKALAKLVETADVFVESFRPGVAKRLGAGYDELSAINPKLIYCSLTGYGQEGPLAQEAGHDINYLALTGVLGTVGPADAPPSVPLNLIADFAGGSFVATIGILAALFERVASGKGQHVDAAMIDGCLSLMAMYFPVWGTDALPGRGQGILAGGAPYYRCYPCADGRHLSIGSLEPQFFAALWAEVGSGPLPDHMNRAEWPRIEKVLASAFLAKPRDHWAARFAGKDACVMPVLDPDEVWQHAQIRQRTGAADGDAVPTMPRFSRTALHVPATDATDRTVELLGDLGLSVSDIERASPAAERKRKQLMEWPPSFSG